MSLRNRSQAVVFVSLIHLCVNALSLSAATPRIRTFDNFAEFERASLTNISIQSAGKLVLGPRSQLMLDTGDPYIWRMVAGRDGSLYVGTGNDGRVYRISAAGDTSLFFDARELEVYALALDRRGNLYAGTSPKGRVYKISPSGDAEVFFEPEETYIWDLQMDISGDLLVATGDSARIYRISPDGRAHEAFRSDQTHVRCIAVDDKGCIYAGTSGLGYVYRIEGNQSPFVLFDSQMAEIHSLVLSPDGYLFAATYGEAPSAQMLVQRTVTVRPGDQSGKEADMAQPGAELSLSPMAIMPETMMPGLGESGLFRIDLNGYGRNLWNFSQNQIHVLLPDPSGGVLVGTGSSGVIYHVATSGEVSLIAKMDGSQITALCYAADKSLIAGTSNMGFCYRLQNNGKFAGHAESETIDAGLLADWGTLAWKGDPAGGEITFLTRSGNAEKPEATWSAWQPVAAAEGVLRITSPQSRFLQWRCEMRSVAKVMPFVEEISISYIQKNLPPEVLAIMVHKPGEYFAPQDNPPTSGAEKNRPGIVFAQSPGKAEYKKGYLTVDWLFEDPNLDGLQFTLHYRKTGTAFWRELAVDLQNNWYAWDAAQMADGAYQIKVMASDAPGLPKTMALHGEKISEIFVVDNTGPLIKNVVFSRKDRMLRFQVSDENQPVARVEYGLDAQGWQLIYPVDGIYDSKLEQFEVPIEPDRTDFTIKASDTADNYSISHSTIKGEE